ncbi:MAG: alpha-1,4-glucan--maltose-1-phosphate maltosyltransferase [Nitrospirota bacterium]
MSDGRLRVVIENVKPEIGGGTFPAKRVIGEKVTVEADIFTDGHDSLSARLLYKKIGSRSWKEAPMAHIENDRWRGEFTVGETGNYVYTLTGWVNHFATWQRDLGKKYDAGQDIRVDILIGINLIREAAERAPEKERPVFDASIRILTGEGEQEKIILHALSSELRDLMDRYPDMRFSTLYVKELPVVVDRQKALFSTWYEMFPRSCSREPGRHGTFQDCAALLPEIQRMGFDVLYFPPIHPIGKTNRKGKNNTLRVTGHDVGSPWAIGSEEGGHKAVHPELGTLEDFRNLVGEAEQYGIEIAMDIALQCSPDHPYVKEHPEWFKWRPDGSIQFAENPPKRYEDILPLNFETEDWEALWNEIRDIFLFWIENGIRIFRVDNPHTKPFRFWNWLITGIKARHPGVIFLSEAFTRPKVMYRLAKEGFSQSYTYFTWRNTKHEIREYINELAATDAREFFRPNFWPNTPDILPEHLQYGGRNAFMMRLVLAATLSSSYGIYGPAFELIENRAQPGREEYLDSEKYELKTWDRNTEGNLKDFIARINTIRRENPALQATYNIRHYEIDNDRILAYGKATEDYANILLVVVNLDPFHTHAGWVTIPIRELGIDPRQPYLVHDLIGDDKYIWQGERNYVEINPYTSPASIFRIRKRLKRETDFDYFM